MGNNQKVYHRPGTAKNFISESMDQYRWPQQIPEKIKKLWNAAVNLNIYIKIYEKKRGL